MTLAIHPLADQMQCAQKETVPAHVLVLKDILVIPMPDVGPNVLQIMIAPMIRPV